MLDLDLADIDLRSLNQRLHDVGPKSNERAFRVLNPRGAHAIAVGLTDPLSSKEMIEALHDFKDHLHFKPAPLWTHAGPRDGPAKPR